MSKSNWYRIAFRSMQVASTSVFAGRAYQHIHWDAPFRTLLWDEAWMSPIVQGVFGTPWQDYITSIAVDDAINATIIGFGWFYALCAVAVWLLPAYPRLVRPILVVGTLALVLLAFLYMKEQFYRYGQFFEYTLQFGSPALLLYMYRTGDAQLKFVRWLSIAIAITFVSHGLYAFGYYPRPGHFVQMCISILGITEGTAVQFLYVAGVLDFLLAVLLFSNRRYLVRAAAIYAALWGLLTAIARVWSGFYLSDVWGSLDQTVYETVYRLPHFIAPALLAWMTYRAWIHARSRFDQPS